MWEAITGIHGYWDFVASAAIVILASLMLIAAMRGTWQPAYTMLGCMLGVMAVKWLWL